MPQACQCLRGIWTMPNVINMLKLLVSPEELVEQKAESWTHYKFTAVKGQSKPAVSRVVKPGSSPPSQQHFLHYTQNLLWGALNCPDTCWRDNTGVHKKCRKFLECFDGNFLAQVIEEPMRGGALLDLILTNKDERAEDVKAGGNLGCDDPEMMDFRMLRRGQV
ncbi:hypothetical protein QYF61_016723 [Mycteria americana]|uniref:Uncharacterized protein n=1 Tax=Mycteria americana TaxID=33587 RepID=A0AAN7S1R8_MYCAM|nr:hypothetical protein QYF61_016723 [Mycteria americana]